MATLLEAPRQARPDATAAHDHDVHAAESVRSAAFVCPASHRAVTAEPVAPGIARAKSQDVVDLSDIGKRLLGRKLRSAQLGDPAAQAHRPAGVRLGCAVLGGVRADEILLTLSLAGLAAYSFSWKIAILVAVVMLVVVASYRQNVHAYPSGGGDYEVATVNLGPNAGLTVGSALLVDYVLTVAVSVSSGVANAKSIFPVLDGREAIVAAGVTLILMALNLRGVRESGTFFAIPTYCFMFGILSMVIYGLFKIEVLGEPVVVHSAQYGIEPDPNYAAFTGFAMIALLARTFSSGCAVTGVEAISNGVPAFRKPKSKNAATTLLLLGTIGRCCSASSRWPTSPA